MTKTFVYRALAGILVSGLAICARGQASLANPSSLPRIAPSPHGPATYGTVATSYLTIWDAQFSPFNSAVTYDDLGNGAAKASRFATGGSGVFLVPVNLPSGALITSLEVDVCDSNASAEHVMGTLGACDLLGETCAAIGTPIVSVSNVVIPCARLTEDLSSLNYTVDNLTSRLFVEVITSSLDNTNSISGALIGYKLQVSPAPATATFGDVPTSHPFFRAIEALAASGITSGCGGGNYCPDQPVTRGEIAKFFANALGLQHP